MDDETIKSLTKDQLLDLVADILVEAHDWRSGKPDSMRDEDWWSGAWAVADEILDILKQRGFEWPEKKG